ncbi:hypothetical protein [Lacinutrix chionoecetis]
MKKQLLFVVYLCFYIAVTAQVRIGDFNVAQYSHSNVSKSLLEDFKNSKTYFVINDNLALTTKDFEEILEEIWTVTPFEVVTSKETSRYLTEGNSLVYFDSFTITKEKDFVQVSVHSFTVFDIFMPEKIKKKRNGEYKFKRKRLGALYFTLDVDGRKEVVAQKKKITGDIFNYRTGYLKNAFQNINSKLINREAVDIYEDFSNDSKVKTLKKNTLYFSEELIYGYDAGFVDKKDAKTVEEIFEDYNYDYKVISNQELNKMIVENKESFYYLLYHQINSNKILNVIESNTGEVILQEYNKMSFTLKPKDLKKLSKTIEKAN